MSQVCNSHNFPTTVHRELRHSQINSTNTSKCRNNRTNGTTTRAIRTNTELLNWNLCCTLPRQFSYNESSYAICCISLILVSFDSDTSIHLRSMVLLVLT